MGSNQHTVLINGVEYDALTGLKVQSVKPSSLATANKEVTPSSVHHKHPHSRSSTLRRRSTKLPQKSSVHQSSSARTPKSPMIKKFAPDISSPKKTVPAQAKSRTVISDFGPSLHPVQQKVIAKQQLASAPSAAPITNKDIKNGAIENALAASRSAGAAEHKEARGSKRFASIAGVTFALLILGSYLTYTNLPYVSVRFAAVQAGINASLPSYRPGGYSISGPISYQNGRVFMQFKANAGPQSFSILQEKSTWDSSALLENFVLEASKKKYETYSDSGLTVFIYGTNAAWVNGGVLHTVTGNAPLTTEQIRKIATSM